MLMDILAALQGESFQYEAHLKATHGLGLIASDKTRPLHS